MANENIVNDLNNIINQTLVDIKLTGTNSFILEVNSGNEEISAATKRLSGLLTQPTAANTNAYYSSKSHFIKNGASEEAAASLSLMVANVTKLTGKSYAEVIEGFGKSGIGFDDNTHRILNNLRDSTSQYLNYYETNNRGSINRNVSYYDVPPPAPATTYPNPLIPLSYLEENTLMEDYREFE